MIDLVTNPVFLGLAAAVYILFIHKPKDEAEGGQADATTSTTKAKDTTLIGRVVDRVESKVLQKAQAAAARHNLPIVADLLGAVERGDGPGLVTVAENLSETMATPEGRRYLLGKTVRSWIAEIAEHDPGEFTAIAADVNNRKKDIEDNAKRIASNGDLKAQ